MPIAVEAEVRDVLADFEPVIGDAIDAAWNDDWINSPFRALISWKRVRANYLHERIVRRISMDLGGNNEVRIFSSDETAKFLFRDRVVARLKKGDRDGLGTNIETQCVLDFIDAQAVLPNFPPEAQKVEILYFLNDLETKIERVLVTARHRYTRLWAYELRRGKGGEIVPLIPQAPIGDGSGGVVVRPRRPSKPDSEIG